MSNSRVAGCVAAGLLIGASPLVAAPAAKEPEPALHLRASISTAGPYGESWYLTLAPSGEATLQVFYSTNPSGNLMARFALPDERVATIRRALESESFLTLPEDVTPATVAMHMPDLQLEIWSGLVHRKVRLYDPKQVKLMASGAGHAKRFLGVWSAVFEGLPLRPAW